MKYAQNFVASWQLFPEKGIYETGERPKSSFYKIEQINNSNDFTISHNWVTLQNEAFTTSYTINADGGKHACEYIAAAEEAQVISESSTRLLINLYRQDNLLLEITHEILPNGYLKITQKGLKEDNSSFTNLEVYHKQMSVLPYSSAVGGAIIKPNNEGVIKHKALTAMEEQTNMQLDQIRRQIELLAQQAQEIHHRKELSMMIYDAKLSFIPAIGHTYFLYLKHDNNFVLSLISPKEWGGSGPFQKFEAAVRLLADHTWQEV
jgi:Protein of unknown function (DUF2452)